MIEVNSTPALAGKVAARLSPKLPVAVSIAEVPELAVLPNVPCDSTDLLCWMGLMTAGPPTLAAQVLRSAAGWAWVRYRWALDDDVGLVRPTPEARSIRNHTRSMFSETVGVGAAGYLGCLQLLPPGMLSVVNLDDSIDPLLRSGVIRRRSGFGRKQPDYLLASGLAKGAPHLLAIECKGTVKSEAFAIAQLAAGVHQVIGLESIVPMRRIVFATSLSLDSRSASVRCHAIEIVVEDELDREPNLDAAREGLLDAALVRALRSIGRYGLADRVLQGYEVDLVGIEPSFEIDGRRMIGNTVELEADEARLLAAVGVDAEVLQSLLASAPERRAMLEPVAQQLRMRDSVRRRRVEGMEVEQETLMGDGVGIRVYARDRRRLFEE